MAQRRYWNFEDDDATKDLIRWLTGILAPGVYHGFDLNPTANMNLNLIHTSTGFKDVDDLEIESGFIGLIITRQGTVVKQDVDITINGIANGHATLPRIDIVVLTHTYTEVVGGSTALYSVITGTPNALPVAPALTSAETQIKIAELYIPATTTALNGVGVVYTRSTPPEFAGLNIIGSRLYTQQNILVNSETITASLERIDLKFKSTAWTNVIWTGPGDNSTGLGISGEPVPHTVQWRISRLGRVQFRGHAKYTSASSLDVVIAAGVLPIPLKRSWLTNNLDNFFIDTDGSVKLLSGGSGTYISLDNAGYDYL